MRAILNVLTSRWFISLLGVLLLCALILFFGHWIAIAGFEPFDRMWKKLVVVAVILAIWATVILIGWLRRRRTNADMVRDLSEAPPDGDAAVSAEQVAEVRERMQEAMALLRQARLGGEGRGGGRQYLYQLPWYIMIGPPGSGKTTALQHSGLRFPLADRLRGDSLEVRGVGGTRNCDWFFTNEAVLIDTAGRYTTQDSHQQVDSAGWLGFLGMLKRYRKRQPINGVLVAISIADLITLPEAERLSHARAIKLRLRELHKELGIRFPVYVLFTKCDLMAGFIEFFDDLGKQERQQVWGCTFALDDGKSGEGVVQQFGPEFDLLLQRINERLIERLHQEQDPQRRGLIFGFPQQLSSLKEMLNDFLREIFTPSRFEERPLLRGVYLTSGTQYGTPIDRLMGAMAATFGLGRQQLTAAGGSGRSYFLTRLLRNVVFAEASLVSANPKVEKRRRWMHRIAYAAAAVLVVGMGGAWYASYANNLELIGEAEDRIESYEAGLAGLSLNPVDDSDPMPVLPALDTLRDMPGGYGRAEEDVPLSYQLGLYQGDTLGAQGTQAYREALNALFLPRLLLRLEEAMAAEGNQERTDFLYETLRVYLMLGGRAPVDDQPVRDWFARDWQRAALAAGRPTEVVADLSGHLTALLDLQPLEPPPLNGPLIERVESILGEIPLAARAYQRIQDAPQARALRDWRVVDHGGPSVDQVLRLRSGDPLTAGVDGLYTYEGFHDFFLGKMVEVAREVMEERTIIEGGSQVDEMQLGLLEEDILGLYLDDYSARWDLLLSDLEIVEFTSLDHATTVSNILSGANSPLRRIMTGTGGICHHTRLARPREDQAAGGEAEDGGALGAVGDVLGSLAQYEMRRRLTMRQTGLRDTLESGLQGSLGGDQDLPPPGQFVNDRFEDLHEFAGCLPNSPDPSPLDDLIRQFADVRSALSRLESDPTGAGSTALQDLAQDASLMPDPVGALAGEVARQASDAAASGAGGRLAEIWRSDVQDLCLRATNNRYPLFRGSPTDMRMADFTQLFAPNGHIDEYFQTHLEPYVDTSRREWTWRPGAIDLGLPSHALVRFQFAAEIRDAFWPNGGGGTPEVSFDLTLVSLDATATRVTVDVDGDSRAYDHGPLRDHTFTWPGQRSRARIAFTPQIAGASSITREGTWAWFRLLDAARISGSASDRFTVDFNVGNRSARFQLQAGSVVNPFNLRALENFRCPVFR
jgi:type VI secretion system protein ImpL